MKLYHGSHNATAPVVIVGYNKTLGENLFDGIFLGSQKTAESHGPCVYEYDVNDELIATSSDLSDGWDITIKVVAKEIDSNDEDVIADIAQLAINDDCDGIVDYIEYLYCEQDNAHAAWELQRIRGRIAATLGYDAVEMDDEHGTTYLLVK